MSVDFNNNFAQRIPCVLVLDASFSMSTRTSSGKTRIQELNQGIVELEKSLQADQTAISRVQLSIVVVGGPSNSAELMMDWTDAVNFNAFSINANGGTPLAEGIEIGLQQVEIAKNVLKDNGISYTRPWMMIISDGEPTSDAEDWVRATTKSQDAEKQNQVEIFCIAVEGANTSKLNEISSIRPSVELSGMKFKELFVWLSDSLSAVTRSRPGEKLNLPDNDPWKNVGL